MELLVGRDVYRLQLLSEGQVTFDECSCQQISQYHQGWKHYNEESLRLDGYD